MRFLVSIAVLLLIAGSGPAFRVTAQEQSLLDLLPTAAEIGPDFVAVDDRTRTLDDQATGFANANDAARRLSAWSWQENAFQVFQSSELTPAGAPVATVDISLTRFANARDAAAALPYFLEDRAAVLGQREIPNPGPIGDEARAIDGQVPGGYDLTLFVRSGALLMRVSSTSASGSPLAAPDQIARGIIARAAGQTPPLTLAQPAAYLPATLPLADADCFRIAGEGELDVPGIVERLAGLADPATRLEKLGWEGGAYRQFACDAPPGSVGWVDVSVHQFADASAAAAAVDVFARSRAQGMHLAAAPVIDLGESDAAITGPAINGTEYTLYLSSGALLYAITGVAPAGDPRANVETIATVLYEQSLANPGAAPTPATAIPVAVPPTATPIPTAPPAPPLAPLPAPTIAPIPTEAPLPATATPVPPATFTPTPIPLPTETPVPDTIPVQVPEAQPTTAPPASSGAPPTPTPRVIHPPTPAGG